MKNKFNTFLSKIRTLLDKAVLLSSFEYFDDDNCPNDPDEYWCSFAYETA